MIITTSFGKSALVDYIMIIFKFGDIFHMEACTELAYWI